MLLQILTLLGSLAMFLYGMSLMSGGLQKMAGNRLRLFTVLLDNDGVRTFLSTNELSAAALARVRELYRIIGEMESMGDFIINISQSVYGAKTV